MVEQGRAVGILPPSESSPAEDRGEVVALVEQLQQAGWSIGDVVLRGEGGGQVWIVLGRRGSDLTDGQRRDAPRGVASGAGPGRGGRDVAGSAAAGERIGGHFLGDSGRPLLFSSHPGSEPLPDLARASRQRGSTGRDGRGPAVRGEHDGAIGG